MFEQDNNPEKLSYEDKLVLLSRYADSVLLSSRRQQFAYYGYEAKFADCGMWFDIDDEAINEFAINQMIDPLTGVSISAFGDANEDSETSRRDLYITLKSRELNTTYMVACNRDWYSQVDVAKSKVRIYGVPEVDDYGNFSAMFEDVRCSNLIGNAEFTLLFMVLDYIEMSGMAKFEVT